MCRGGGAQSNILFWPRFNFRDTFIVSSLFRSVINTARLFCKCVLTQFTLCHHHNFAGHFGSQYYRVYILYIASVVILGNAAFTRYLVRLPKW